MDTNKELNYKLYIHKTTGFVRTSFNMEFERYAAVKNGNVEQVKKNLIEIKKDFLAGKGRLSDDPIRNIRYHVIIATAQVSRACVDGGMPHDTAYTLSDIYIQRADKCTSESKLIDILEEMQIDYASRMKMLKKEQVISLHIRKSIDYIYDHLNEQITVKHLSTHIGLNESYLSTLFKQETGSSITEFVHNAKIKTAENMLIFSDYSSSEIALSLGFSSQSAFIALFRRTNGITPKKFRDQYAK